MQAVGIHGYFTLQASQTLFKMQNSLQINTLPTKKTNKQKDIFKKNKVRITKQSVGNIFKL